MSLKPKRKEDIQKTNSKKRARVGLQGKPLPKHLQLRTLKVGQQTLNRYLQCIDQFEEWCKQKRLKTSASFLDRSVTKYITHLYDSDLELSTATYTIYGLQLLRCEVQKDSFLVSAKLALAGWRKTNPGQMRIPVPEEFVFDLCFLALEQNRQDIAMCLCLQYDGYMRPSECLNLRGRQICPPANRRYRHWAVVLAPSELHETSKTGTSDDSILTGDKFHNAWIREPLRLWMKHIRKDDSLFPNVSLSFLEHWCRSACLSLGYNTPCIMPHVVRHAAASNDVYHGRRDLTEVQKSWGRWECRKSVSRYSKHALLLHQWKQAPLNRKTVIERRSQSLPVELTKSLRNLGDTK